MRFYSVIVACVAGIALLTGCNKDDGNNSCPEYEACEATQLVAPDSVMKDSLILISVGYSNPKDCQRFLHFTSQTNDSITSIGIQTEIDTCNCQSQHGFHYQYYKYHASANFTHSIIRVHVADSIYLSDTIVVY